jgi:aminopeptidase N
MPIVRDWLTVHLTDIALLPVVENFTQFIGSRYLSMLMLCKMTTDDSVIIEDDELRKTMPIFKYLAFGAIALLLSNQSLATDNLASKDHNGITTVNNTLREHSESLSSDYANFRSQQILAVDYQLSFVFDKQQNSFSGTTLISATLAENNSQAITLDFELGTIESIKVNNKSVDWHYDKWFISLAANLFNAGENSIEISYRRPYATDGSGLHRFVDPEDGAVYLYSDFEPYDANRMFPHFDQPDLKASFQSQVTAPADWHVISTTRETTITEHNDTKIWRFPASKKISSYVYAVHAGPYHVWQDQFESIPLRLFARQSIAQYVKPQDWFIPTKQSFAFFNQYFDFYYPFGKYDQIMAPDFNSGAMENVAAVTFNEGYVSRGEKSISRKRDLANTIAHEMAHMWFGDLVTMKWWNGLWLNESFATYMANLALAEASDYDHIWDTFYASTKQWAYAADQSVNTHAIELPVLNTAEAFSNFDGITYGKGASVLKQIPYYLGEDNFRIGVANYLKKFAYQNTTLDDFIGELGKAAQQDLSQWTEQWLYQAGLNSISANYACVDGKISDFTIEQSAPADFPTLRTQRVQVGLYQLVDGKLVLAKAIPTLYQGAHTKVANAIGAACPALVYPNVDDWGFVKVNLDARSLTTLNQHINEIESSSLRLMLWQSLWDSVRDIKLPLQQYVQFAIANIGAEQDDTIVRKIAGHLSRASSYLMAVQQAGKNAHPLRQQIEQLMWHQLQQAQAGSEQQKIWYGRFVYVAHSPESLAKLQQILQGELSLAGLTIDQDKRWSIIEVLNEFQFGEYQALLAAEIKRDPSDSGVKSAIVAEVVRPDPSIKAKWFDVVLHNPEQLKLSVLRNIMSSLFPFSQNALMKPYEQKILAEIPRLNKQADYGFLTSFASRLAPATCNDSSVVQLSKAVQDFAQLNPQVFKSYKEHLQDDQRCVDIVKLALN